jgi:hypothetical protein
MSKEAHLHSLYSVAKPQMVLAHTEICSIHVKALNDYTVRYSTTNECYNEQFLSIKSDATTKAEEYYQPT